MIYQQNLPGGGGRINVSGGKSLHHGNEMPENTLLPLSVAIADEKNAMADTAKINANNTLLNHPHS